MRNDRLLAVLAVDVGIVLIVIAIVYWMEPAKSLPGFFPGHEAGSAHHHVKHGIAAFLVGRLPRLCLVPHRPEARAGSIVPHAARTRSDRSGSAGPRKRFPISSLERDSVILPKLLGASTRTTRSSGASVASSARVFGGWVRDPQAIADDREESRSATARRALVDLVVGTIPAGDRGDARGIVQVFASPTSALDLPDVQRPRLLDGAEQLRRARAQVDEDDDARIARR